MHFRWTPAAARRITPVVVLTLLASCTDRPPRAAESPARRDTTLTAAGEVVRARPDSAGWPVIRALYVNRWHAQNPKSMQKLFRIADSTEINGLVIDMKDEFGLNFTPSDKRFARYAESGHGVVGDVRALVDSVKAHGLVPIARIVTFKDPTAAAANEQWTIRQPDGTAWKDKEGLPWVNPYNHELWEYDIGIAEELARLGFEEIQWDYIRFPEPYHSLPRQVFPGATTSKPEILAEYLRTARERLAKLGARSTADVFGFVATIKGPLEVGQEWEKLAPVTDVLLPMLYPSHFPHGSFGIERPNAEPYRIVRLSLDTARARDERLGITKPGHVRAWLQAFTLGHMKPEYGPEQIREQKRAVYDAGYQGWVLWNPASNYDAYLPALEPRGERPPLGPPADTAKR